MTENGETALNAPVNKAQPPDIDWSAFPSPCYVIDEGLLIRNLRLLREVADAAGCRVLLAQKGFSAYFLYPLIARYLDGAAASSLHEARLAAEEMGKEVHTYSPAYRDDEIADITIYSSHVVFNSFSQWRRHRDAVKFLGGASCGIRLNPEYSEIETAIYNPCAPHSRLGVIAPVFAREAASGGLSGLDGLHFHTMCEQDSGVLERTLDVVRRKFGAYLRGVRWVNFGGGHHITRPGYDIETLVRCVRNFRDEFGLDVYLEPGEAVALNTGFLVSTVLDIVENEMQIAVMDASAACHMPDVLEMPYCPQIIGAVENKPAGNHSGYPHAYRLGGPTCLAGDVIGDYAFKRPLSPGDRLVFTDMAHYTMVKNNTFNGVNLPSIAIRSTDGTINVIKYFSYQDYKSRL